MCLGHDRDRVLEVKGGEVKARSRTKSAASAEDTAICPRDEARLLSAAPAKETAAHEDL